MRIFDLKNTYKNKCLTLVEKLYIMNFITEGQLNNPHKI